MTCLFALVFLNLMIAGKNQFIMQFIDYKLGMEYRLLAPSFAWLWGTLLTIIISCWVVRIRTINWLCKYEIERMDTVVAIKLTTKDDKIRELAKKIQTLVKERQELLNKQREGMVFIGSKFNINKLQ